MKKLLVTCALLGAVTAAFAQGTVQFSNNTLYKISLITPGVSSVQIPVTANINFGLFYGIGESTSLTLSAALGISSTSAAGIIANPSDRKTTMLAYQVPNSNPGETDVWIQIKGWDASFGSDWVAGSKLGNWFGQSAIVNVGALGPATGPGVAIWQGATGTVTTAIPAFGLTPVPEPTTMALAGLGIASLLIFRRRK